MTPTVDWDTTHTAIVRRLSTERRPLHYRTLRDDPGLSYIAGRGYGPKTDAAEKIRQHYSEQEQPDTFNHEGYIALRRWFASVSQLQLYQPQDRVVIRGNCIVSYNAGYEQAKRQPHMKDYFGDGDTVDRQERRRRASLVETHVRHYFKTHYPQYYQPPSNEGRYDQWAYEDFYLDLPGYRLVIDVKSWTTDGDDGQGRGYIRKPKDQIVYLWAKWLDNETVEMTGIQPGAYTRIFGDTQDGQLYSVNGRFTQSIDTLLVALNMARYDLDYFEWRRRYRAKYSGGVAA